MEFKCNLCGKTHTDPNSYAKCVNACNEKRIAAESEAKRKKAEEGKQKLIDEINFHIGEAKRLNRELYDLYPEVNEEGGVYKYVFPNFDWDTFMEQFREITKPSLRMFHL